MSHVCVMQEVPSAFHKMRVNRMKAGERAEQAEHAIVFEKMRAEILAAGPGAVAAHAIPIPGGLVKVLQAAGMIPTDDDTPNPGKKGGMH